MSASGDRVRELEERADALAARGDWSELRELLGEEEREVALGRRNLAYRLGEALYHTGRMSELREVGTVAERRARRSVDLRWVMEAMNLVGMAAFQLGETGEARERFDAVVELAEAEDDREMLARAVNNLGALANLKGRPEEALANYQLVMPVYERLGQERGLCQTLHNLGISYRDLGRHDEADGAYRRAAALARRIGYVPVGILSTAGRAEIALLRGDRGMGERLAERALEAARETGSPILLAEALRVRARARAGGDAGGRERAAADLAEGLEWARRAGNRLLEAELLGQRGRLEADRGAEEAARRDLREALRIFRELGAVAEAEEIGAELDGPGSGPDVAG